MQVEVNVDSRLREKTRPKFLFGLSDESIKPLFGLDLLVEGFIGEFQKSSLRIYTARFQTPIWQQGGQSRVKLRSDGRCY